MSSRKPRNIYIWHLFGLSTYSVMGSALVPCLVHPQRAGSVARCLTPRLGLSCNPSQKIVFRLTYLSRSPYINMASRYDGRTTIFSPEGALPWPLAVPPPLPFSAPDPAEASCPQPGRRSNDPFRDPPFPTPSRLPPSPLRRPSRCPGRWPFPVQIDTSTPHVSLRGLGRQPSGEGTRGRHPLAYQLSLPTPFLPFPSLD